MSLPGTAAGAGGGGPGSGDAHPWRVAAYAGRHTATRFNEIVRLQTRFRDSDMAAVAVSRTLPFPGPAAGAVWDVEVQGAQHWGLQQHAEINAAIMLRWTRFPWCSVFSTTTALGVGPSYAFSVPRLEEERGRHSSRRLVFMPFEITTGPVDRRWEIFTRVHHRSGAFDLISRGAGSNFVTAGLRKRW